MSPASKSSVAAIGFRVKTGRAAAVLLTGTVKAPRVLVSRAVELWDPKVPASRQPFHAGLEHRKGDDAPIVKRACDAARAVARRVVGDLADEVRRAGHEPRAIGLVVSSDTDPTSLRNPHVRAHAAEGLLFREALEEGAAALGLPCLALIEREAYQRAAPALGKTAAQLKLDVASLGKEVIGPWRAEEKTAALAAWVALTRR